jgi:hypothetical protein
VCIVLAKPMDGLQIKGNVLGSGRYISIFRPEKFFEYTGKSNVA